MVGMDVDTDVNDGYEEGKSDLEVLDASLRVRDRMRKGAAHSIGVDDDGTGADEGDLAEVMAAELGLPRRRALAGTGLHAGAGSLGRAGSPSADTQNSGQGRQGTGTGLGKGKGRIRGKPVDEELADADVLERMNRS